MPWEWDTFLKLDPTKPEAVNPLLGVHIGIFWALRSTRLGRISSLSLGRVIGSFLCALSHTSTTKSSSRCLCCGREVRTGGPARRTRDRQAGAILQGHCENLFKG